VIVGNRKFQIVITRPLLGTQGTGPFTPNSQDKRPQIKSITANFSINAVLVMLLHVKIIYLASESVIFFIIPVHCLFLCSSASKPDVELIKFLLMDTAFISPL
jgi:hypothetical protein